MATELILPAGKVLAREGDVGFEMFILLWDHVSDTRWTAVSTDMTAGMSWGTGRHFGPPFATPRWWPKPN